MATISNSVSSSFWCLTRRLTRSFAPGLRSLRLKPISSISFSHSFSGDGSLCISTRATEYQSAAGSPGLVAWRYFWCALSSCLTCWASDVLPIRLAPKSTQLCFGSRRSLSSYLRPTNIEGRTALSD